MTTNTKNINKELFDYSEFYTGEVNPLSIYLEEEREGVLKLYKFGGQLYQSVYSILNYINNNSDNEIEFIGATLQRDALYKINGKIYKVADGYFWNNETKAELVLYKGNYVYTKEYWGRVKRDIKDFK